MRKQLERLLKKNEDIIQRIEFIEEATRGLLSVLKAKIVFINADSLYLREIRRGDELVAYSYYWLSYTEELIEGWDNAPHHNEITTHPNHKHTKDSVESLKNPNIELLLKKIRREILE